MTIGIYSFPEIDLSNHIHDLPIQYQAGIEHPGLMYSTGISLPWSYLNHQRSVLR